MRRSATDQHTFSLTLYSWVFINGKLTSCDLGSIHIARTCTLNLDAYGMLPNSTNEMLILRRKWRECVDGVLVERLLTLRQMLSAIIWVALSSSPRRLYR